MHEHMFTIDVSENKLWAQKLSEYSTVVMVFSYFCLREGKILITEEKTRNVS